MPTIDHAAGPVPHRLTTTALPPPRIVRAGLLALLAVMVLLAAAVLARPAEADDVDTTNRVRQILEDGSTGGTVGLYLKEVGGPDHAAHNQGFVFEPASTVKALIHFHAMRQVEDGTVIGGQPVTLSRQIPWVADTAKFDGNGNYDPGGADCPTDNTVAMTSQLSTMAQWMMGPSDNATTQGLRDFFGDADIDATRQALGMDDTVLKHVVGCGGPPANKLTLVDAGKLFEEVATGYLTTPATAYQFMPTDGGTFNAIIDQEAVGLGLSSGAVSDFKAARRSALKAGSYTLSGGTEHRSVAGWGELGFKDTSCAIVPREFVYGAFIHAAAQPPTAGIRATGVELFREQIRNGLESWAACEADLELADVSIVDPPSEIDVNTPVTLTVRHVVANNGPAQSMDAEVSTTVDAPSDCAVQPGVGEQPVTLAAGGQQVVDHEVTIECADPSFHPIDVDATIAPTNPAVVDPDPTNNADATSETIAVIAHADLAVTDLDLAALDGAGLGDLLVGQDFVFDAPVTLHNFGDTALGLYPDPVDGDVSRTLAVPAGVTGSVQVTAAEAPGTVVVDEDGQAPVTHTNQAAGAVVTVTGPATLTVHSVASALEVGADHEVATAFGLGCEAPGLHDIGFTATIEPSDQHVLDPQADNDTLEAARTVDCVTPVQINIRPGNANNFLDPAAPQTAPVAILTTAAGEYDLPLAFDATTVHHPTVRFGTTGTLDDGGGSSASPNRAFVRDSVEMDDKTKDGDDDMVLLFALPGTGVDDQTTEVCTVGTYDGAGTEPLTFYGCDAVQTPPGNA